jgi:Ca2+-binding EF-hand superfamily protein
MGTSPLTNEKITQEFRELDLTGEGRLKFLPLRSALELRECDMSDEDIRRWLRESDRHGKGYVDLNDYLAIFGKSSDQRQKTMTTTAFDASSTRAEPHSSEAGQTSSLSSSERRVLLKQAFSKFDIDRDGFISVADLRAAFESQNRPYSDADLIAWVKKRDVSDIGAVSFEDFVRYFKN